MKKRFIFILLALITLSVIGCEYTATIVTDNNYDIRIVNKTGETVKIKWDDGSYHYVENECILILSSDYGYHELVWEWKSSSRHSRHETYKIEVDADFEIVIDDDSEYQITIIDD